MNNLKLLEKGKTDISYVVKKPHWFYDFWIYFYHKTPITMLDKFKEREAVKRFYKRREENVIIWSLQDLKKAYREEKKE